MSVHVRVSDASSRSVTTSAGRGFLLSLALPLFKQVGGPTRPQFKQEAAETVFFLLLKAVNRRLNNLISGHVQTSVIHHAILLHWNLNKQVNISKCDTAAGLCLRTGNQQSRQFRPKLSQTQVQRRGAAKGASPTVSAAVLLRDAVLVVAPDVDRGADQRHQHSEAAQEGEDGHALLLALWMEEQTLNPR